MKANDSSRYKQHRSSKLDHTQTAVTDGQAANSLMMSKYSKMNMMSETPSSPKKDRLGTSDAGQEKRKIELNKVATRARTPMIGPIRDEIPSVHTKTIADSHQTPHDGPEADDKLLFDKVQSMLKTSGNPELMKLKIKKRQAQNPTSVDPAKKVKLPTMMLTPIHFERPSHWQTMTGAKQSPRLSRPKKEKQKQPQGTTRAEKAHMLPRIAIQGAHTASETLAQIMSNSSEQ